MIEEKFLARLQSDDECGMSHKIGSSLSESDLIAWKTAHPDFNLPPDFEAFLFKANGIKLRTDLEPRWGVYRLFPLQEIKYAARIMYLENSTIDDQIPKSWLGIGVDTDGTRFLILDCENGKYLDVDPISPDEPDLIGTSVENILDWVIGFVQD